MSHDAFSYASFISALQSCSERLRKNRRNLSKVIPQVTQELDTLLFSIRQSTMNSVCPSARVYEAQVLMNKAVVKRHAGHHLEEAQCYLLADAIWVATERERRGVNYPTSDDALARSVLCSAMACNVLLDNKYPAGQNPIPLRAMGTASDHIQSDPGTFITNALWSPHLARAWAICYRLANVLIDFNCIEMAADYFELAAIIVSVDVNGNEAEGSTTSRNLHHRRVPSPNTAAGSSSSGTTPSGASPVPPNSNPNGGAGASSASLHVDPSQNVRSTSFVGNSAASVVSGAQPFSGGASVYSSSNTGTNASCGLYGKGVGAASMAGGAGSSAHGGNYRTSYAAGSGNNNGASPLSGKGSSSSGSGSRGAKTCPTIGIAPGMLYHYITALLSCAKMCVLNQDYPRALSVMEELANYANYVQKELAEHIKGRVWEARRGRGGGGGAVAVVKAADGCATDGDAAVATNAAAGDAEALTAAAVQRLSQVLIAAVDADGNPIATSVVEAVAAAAVAEAAVAGCGTKEDGAAPQQKDAEEKEETAALSQQATEAEADEALPKPDAFGSAAAAAGEEPQNPADKDTAAATTHHAPAPAAAAPSTTNNASGGAAHASSTDPAHHMFTLLEMGAVIVQMRVMKFCIAIILKEEHDSNTVVNEQVAALRKLAEVWQQHSDGTCRVGLAKARNGLFFNDSTINASAAGGGSRFKTLSSSTSPMPKTRAQQPTTTPTSAATTHHHHHHHHPTTNEMARHLQRLAGTMEMLYEERSWHAHCCTSVPTATSSPLPPPPPPPPSATMMKSNATNTPFTPVRQLLSRRVLEQGTSDLLSILSLMGIRSRDVTILVHRCLNSLVTNKVASVAPHKNTDLAKMRNAALQSSIAAAGPSAAYTKKPSTLAAAPALDTATAGTPIEGKEGHEAVDPLVAAEEKSEEGVEKAKDGGDTDPQATTQKNEDAGSAR